MSKTTNGTQHNLADKPISYHLWLDNAFDGWAAECKWEPKALRQATERAIRTRHHEAIIEHESNRANGKRPDVFTLFLGSVRLYYTVEAEEVMVRGYGWEIEGEPLDDFEGGGFYSEYSWQ